MKALSSSLLIAMLVLTAGSLGFLVARSWRSADGSEAKVVGALAPPLKVKALDGGQIDLAALRGRTVLLNFWASWCGPCIEEMPVLDHFSRSQGADGILVIGIAVEDEADARAFLKEHPVSYTIGLGSASSPDESADFGNRLNVLPYSVLIDAQGFVRRAEARTFDQAQLNDWVR